MLERQRIRNDVMQRLLDANTAAGENVFRARVTPPDEDELPALCVYTPDERGASERGSQHPMFDTTLTLQVDALVMHADGYDDKLDALCEELEAALLQSPDFVSQFERIASYNTTTSFHDGGEVPVAAAIITIDLVFTNEFPPLVGDDLETTHIDVDAIDPADPNTGNEGEENGYAGGQPGPDGRTEASIDITHET